MAARKKTRAKARTPAQKRATKKLIAFNKARRKGVKRKTKKKVLSPARKRAISRMKRKHASSHCYIITATVKMRSLGKAHTRWFTGKGFVTAADRINYPMKRYKTEIEALNKIKNMAPKLPNAITNIQVRKLKS